MCCGVAQLLKARVDSQHVPCGDSVGLLLKEACNHAQALDFQHLAAYASIMQ